MLRPLNRCNNFWKIHSYNKLTFFNCSPFSSLKSTDNGDKILQNINSLREQKKLPNKDEYDNVINKLRNLDKQSSNTSNSILNWKVSRFIVDYNQCIKNPIVADLEFCNSFLNNIIQDDKDTNNEYRFAAIATKIDVSRKLQRDSLLNEAMNDMMNYSERLNADDLIDGSSLCGTYGHLDKFINLLEKAKYVYGEDAVLQKWEQDADKFQDSLTILMLCTKYHLHKVPKSHENIFSEKKLKIKEIMVKLRDIEVGGDEKVSEMFREAVWKQMLQNNPQMLDWQSKDTGNLNLIKQESMCVVDGGIENNDKVCVGPWFDDRIVIFGKCHTLINDIAITENEELYLQQDNEDNNLFIGSYILGKHDPKLPTCNYIYDCKLCL